MCTQSTAESTETQNPANINDAGRKLFADIGRKTAVFGRAHCARLVAWRCFNYALEDVDAFKGKLGKATKDCLQYPEVFWNTPTTTIARMLMRALPQHPFWGAFASVQHRTRDHFFNHAHHVLTTGDDTAIAHWRSATNTAVTIVLQHASCQLGTLSDCYEGTLADDMRIFGRRLTSDADDWNVDEQTFLDTCSVYLTLWWLLRADEEDNH